MCLCIRPYPSSSIIFRTYNGRPWCAYVVVIHAREHINTQSISGRTWILGTRVRQTWGKWYIDIHTIIPRVGAVVLINVGVDQHSPQLLHNCVHKKCLLHMSIWNACEHHRKNILFSLVKNYSRWTNIQQPDWLVTENITHVLLEFKLVPFQCS